MKGRAPDRCARAAASPRGAPVGAPNAEEQHQEVRHPGERDTQLSPSPGDTAQASARPSSREQSRRCCRVGRSSGSTMADRRQRMLVAVPSGAGRMLTAHPATPSSPIHPCRSPGCGDAAGSRHFSGGQIFAEGCSLPPGPAGAARRSFPGPSSEAGQECRAVRLDSRPRRMAQLSLGSSRLPAPWPARLTAAGCSPSRLPRPAQHRRAQARAAREQLPSAGGAAARRWRTVNRRNFYSLQK